MNESLKRDLIAYAGSLGFERIGFAYADSLKNEERYLKHWLAQGRAGEMDYLARQPERRTRPQELLSGAKTVIVLARRYNGDSSNQRSPQEGRVARYTGGRDYHKLIGKRLEAFVRYLVALCPESQSKFFVDTGPVLERALAQRAGVGFIGKNTMLITRGLGSWVFLACVLTSAEWALDAPDARSCGNCRLCIDACPTRAITAPFELDPRRCISYLTIELKGSIEPGLREKMGGWAFGCDICQEVCPHNKGVAMAPAPVLALAEVLSIENAAAFRKRFSGTSLLRAGWRGLLRNACVAAANLGRKDLLPALRRLANHDAEAVIREHASWAIHRLSN
jgi:epoxyqueuosine reductase